MKIAVVGLWHLGLVTAACVARSGHDVVAIDEEATVNELHRGHLPISEPGLAELIQTDTRNGHLHFDSDPRRLGDRDLVWITFDTPVDDDDRADVDFVVDRAAALFPHLAPEATVLVSSQLPVGSTARLEARYRQAVPLGAVSFAYSPENLRLGSALDAFTRARRIVVGIRSERDRERLRPLFEPFSSSLLWMSVESAEMSKHALNAFLATSVAFANELAVLCERVGADARDVEQALRSDERVGPRAYLRAGSAFAGGTLARDLSYLVGIGQQAHVPTPLFDGVRRSNSNHLDWTRAALTECLGELAGRRVAVLGLAYKPGTDTLRRSSALATCRWLVEQGTSVNAFDPAISALPAGVADGIRLTGSADEALAGSDAMLLATEWPEFMAIRAEDLVVRMRQPIAIDPGRFLEANLGANPEVRYVAVGRGR